jgi:hypothetical protein
LWAQVAQSVEPRIEKEELALFILNHSISKARRNSTFIWVK